MRITVTGYVLLAILGCPSANAWMSIATSNQGAWGAVTNQESKELAAATAVKLCNSATRTRTKCSTWIVDDSNGYHAMATSPSYVGYGQHEGNVEVARRNALSACAKHTGRNEMCEIVWVGQEGYVTEYAETHSQSVAPQNPYIPRERCRLINRNPDPLGVPRLFCADN